MGCPSNVGHFGLLYRMLKLNNGRWGREGLGEGESEDGRSGMPRVRNLNFTIIIIV